MIQGCWGLGGGGSTMQRVAVNKLFPWAGLRGLARLSGMGQGSREGRCRGHSGWRSLQEWFSARGEMCYPALSSDAVFSGGQAGWQVSLGGRGADGAEAYEDSEAPYCHLLNTPLFPFSPKP